MIKKVATFIAFAGGTYVGYEHLPEILARYSMKPEYWKYMGGEEIRTFGTQLLHISLAVGLGIACAFVVYMICNLYARAE
jgi:hypothetical protein